MKPLALLFIAAPLAAAAPVPKGGGTPALYFPTAVGAKWEYACGSDAAESEAIEVTAVEQAAGSWTVTLKRADGKAVSYRPVIVSAAGLTQEAAAGDGPACLLKADATAGDTWAIPGGTRTDVGTEDVTVPAGTYAARKVVWAGLAGGVKVACWYAPGVGEVKRVWVSADGTECVGRALRAFTPGK